MKKERGFTLVEIAIVLVIIGLLLGGVMKGQAMIENARTRNLAGELEATAAAVYAYQQRYQRLPGDDERAARWTDADAGDGNGRLDSNDNAFELGNMGNHERRRFWQHLRHAGLLKGDPADTRQPQHAFGTPFGVVSGNGATPLGLSGPIVLCASMVPWQAAEALDLQLDDGRPDSGTLRAQVQTDPAANLGNAAAAATQYSAASGAHYALCKAL